jgi:hypothetical protein
VKPPIVLLLAAALSGAAGCTCSKSNPGAGERAAPAVRALAVTRLKAPLKLDGEATEPDWLTSARTRPFLDATGGEARPFSEARFLWDDANLYVLLYAADNDIRARVKDHDGPVWIDDHFSLHIRPDGAAQPTYAFDISPAGVVMDAKRPAGGKDDASWESGIKLGVDLDGTINDDTNGDDEEWVIEAAIPLRSMGIEGKPGTHLLVDIARCDTPRGTKEKRCGAWGTSAEPHALELTP